MQRLGGDRGHRGGLRSREDSSKNSNYAAVAEYGNGGRSKKWRGGILESRIQLDSLLYPEVLEEQDRVKVFRL